MIAKDKVGRKKTFESQDLKRNAMFYKMHQSILNAMTTACSFEEGLDVMETILIIQEQNDE